jgi:cytidine deaminase
MSAPRCGLKMARSMAAAMSRTPAYPQGVCAEAGAISALVAAGHKRILECVVMGPGPETITPCGGCRQKLREFATDDTLIHLCGPDGLHRTVTLGQLLPMSFGPHHIAQP